jgi:hypothetical protein
MQDVDSLGELRHVVDSMLADFVDAYLTDTEPDGRHRLPIMRIEAVLHSVELLPRRTPRFLWKFADALTAVAAPRNRPHASLYQF